MEIRRFTLNNKNNIVVPSPKSDSLSYNNKEEFEDTKGGYTESVDRRKTDNTMVKRKRTNNDLHNNEHTYKTKDRVT